jgi:sporulation protein YlmC with PRC-barrel domain
MRTLIAAAVLMLQISPALAQGPDGNLQPAGKYVDSLKNREVFRAGAKVGEIDEVLIDVKSRQIAAVVLKYDAAGISLRDRRVIVRFDQIDISSTYPRGASIELTEEELKALPQWTGDR